ncbi:MAG: ethanolamine utilization protein EutH [Anaerovibrio sp.]|uniref:ethanolamine utilization protein EutH n=1 Tax=Anaerovibrio sp. TaxID=1872532 RepID=UPI002E75E677|nr:ethanolamine utilization protein EutH [Anaerovibrio sp.]MEE1307649.1 ethanolamine utilization protein EutH [Anaerovibrio sp.]
MELFGKAVVDIIMLCAACGAVASIVSEDSELGRQFLEGINAIGPIFLLVAGIMAAAPFLTKIVTIVFGPVFQWLGADPAILYAFNKK